LTNQIKHAKTGVIQVSQMIKTYKDSKTAMTRQIKNVIQGPWREQQEMLPPTLYEFASEAEFYLSEIMFLRGEIISFSELFEEEIKIELANCKEVMGTIKVLGRLAQEFSMVIECASFLPRGIVPLRYPLLAKLHYFHKEVFLLKPKIAVFQSICDECTDHSLKQREEIRLKLSELAETSEEIVDQLEILLDQARFQERKFDLSKYSDKS
jgi:hypothetical protein